MKIKSTSGILSTKINPELKTRFNEACRKNGDNIRSRERKLIEPVFDKFIKEVEDKDEK